MALSGMKEAVNNQLSTLQEDIKSLGENSEKRREGLLYIMKKSFIKECERLLNPKHTITFTEFVFCIT